MLQIVLKPGIDGGKWACLRPLCGYDEVSVNGADAGQAVAFLDRLLVEAPGTTVGPGKAKELAVCDCDKLCAALYRSYFGEQVEGIAICRNCSESFELSLSLPRLMADLEARPTANAAGPDDEGIYTSIDGRRFRLPTAGDQQYVMGLDPEDALAALLERCVVEGDSRKNPEFIQAAMDSVGAVLDLDLDAKCPKCGASQSVRFDVQTHLLRTLAQEKKFLNHEVHRIAMTYGWGYGEILRLTREDRRAFVRLIESDRTPRRRAP
jgi:hypothetical protein